jgi:DNA-binding XRE family transcriptional regulator
VNAPQFVTQTRLTYRQQTLTLGSVMKNRSVSEPQVGQTRALLASNLVVLRRQAGLSQEALALEAGVHRTFVAHVERGARNLSIDSVEKLAIGLRVPPMVLLAPDLKTLKSLTFAE